MFDGAEIAARGELSRLVGTITQWGAEAAGATVELRRDYEGPVVASTTTGEAGTFEFDNIRAGSYILRVNWESPIYQRVVSIGPSTTVTIDIASRGSCGPDVGAAQLDDADVAAIVRLALKAEGKMWSDAPGDVPTPGQKRPFVVGDRFPRAWLTRVAHLDPINPDALQRLANRLGQVKYTSITVRPTPGCATVTVEDGILLDEVAMKVVKHLGVSLSTYRFTQRDGRWEFDLSGFVIT